MTTMKLITIAVLATIISTAANAQYYTGNSGFGYGTGSNSRNYNAQGHYRQNGSYVQPHQRTAPNNTQYDNYGTRGNYNPYTGQFGTRNPRW